MNPRALLVPAVTAALLSAGCDGGSSTALPAMSSAAVSHAAAGSTVAKADYIKQADAICATAAVAGKAMSPPGNAADATTDQLGGWASYLDEVGATQNGAAAQLAALPRPDQGVDQVAAWLTRSAAVFSDLSEASAAAKRGNLEAFKAAAARSAVDGQSANQLAAAYGLVDCAR